MISHKHKFIFVHIPKTGGGSIDDILSLDDAEYFTEMKRYHWTAKNWNCNFPNEWDFYFKFTFVRNPWDLRVSSYHYGLKQPGRHGRNARNKTFEQYIRTYTPYHKAFRGKHQSHFLGNVSEFDFIGRFENLQDDFDIVCDKIEIPMRKLPHIHKTDHTPYWDYYTDETRELIAKLYAKDIETFGYKFGE